MRPPDDTLVPPKPDASKISTLEQEASVARERLLQAIDALDDKRKRITKSLPLGAIALAVVGGLVTAGVFALTKRRPKPKTSTLTHLRPPQPKPSMLKEVARKVGTSVLVFALTEAGKLAVAQAVKGLPTAEEPEPMRHLT